MGVFASHLAFPDKVCRLLGYILTRNASVCRGRSTTTTDERTCFGCSNARAHHAVARLGVRTSNTVAVARRRIATGLSSEVCRHGRTSRVRAPIPRLTGLLLRQKLRLLQADVMLAKGTSYSLTLVQIRRCGRY